MKREYELISIFSAEVSEEKIQATLNKIKNIIQNKGEIVVEENWGNKKLSYKIKKQNHGIYYYIKFRSEAEIISEIKKFLMTNEEIIRYGIFKVEVKKEKIVKKKLNKNILNSENILSDTSSQNLDTSTTA